MSPTAYGFWPSLVSAELLSAQAVKISEPQVSGERLYWLETRPQEQGRTALVCRYQGQSQDVLPAPHSIRTRAQEYGGASYLATAGGVFYVLDADQRIYFLALDQQQPKALTPAGQYRYADFCFDSARHRLIAIREDYTNNSQHPDSAIVAIDLAPKQGDLSERATLAVELLVSGADFYSNPRLAPNGQQLSFLRWNHPAMPWDGTECVVANLDALGKVGAAQVIAGSQTESIFQPQWSPDGELFLVSDRSNWWNIYRWDGAQLQVLINQETEFATPQWVFGMSTYGFLDHHTILCCFSERGQWQLAVINIPKQTLTPIATDFRDISAVCCQAGCGYFLAASATQSTRLWLYEQRSLSALTTATHPLPLEHISLPQAIQFTTSDQEQAHGFFYPPCNPDSTPSDATLPPLIVMCHGGPTGATESSLNLKIQFWTNRGFAVLDINYRGSTGFGRRYRDRLKHNWGITDVIDVCSGAAALVAQGRVNPRQIAIRGSSAGGYTALAALTFSDTFNVGASLYGIGDLEALARDTHKFEAHYLDSLIGAYPAQQAEYRARSPIHHIDQLSCPVIFLQGLQDKVVPPAQAEAMVDALRTKGIRTAYITFAEEGHGFRHASNIQRAINEELAFYQTVLGGL